MKGGGVQPRPRWGAREHLGEHLQFVEERHADVHGAREQLCGYELVAQEPQEDGGGLLQPAERPRAPVQLAGGARGSGGPGDEVRVEGGNLEPWKRAGEGSTSWRC